MKYYVELTVEATYPDSECDRFFHDHPCDTVEEAKSFSATVENRGVTIYACDNDLLTPILTDWFDGTWRSYDGD